MRLDEIKITSSVNGNENSLELGTQAKKCFCAADNRSDGYILYVRVLCVCAFFFFVSFPIFAYQTHYKIHKYICAHTSNNALVHGGAQKNDWKINRVRREKKWIDWETSRFFFSALSHFRCATRF